MSGSIVVDDTQRVVENLFNEDNFRIDRATNKGSVIDVIRLITNQQSRDAGKYFIRMQREHSELGPGCLHIRINGKGKPTPVADAKTLMEIVWLLPGKKAKEFRRSCAQYICRVLGGDPSLVREMEMRTRHTPQEQTDFFMQNVDTPDMDLMEQKERVAMKRKQMELDFSEREERIKRMRAETLQMRAETLQIEANANKISKEAEIEHTRSILSLMSEDEMDERDRIYFHDLKRRLIDEHVNANGLKMLTNGEECKQRQEISLVSVGAKYGLRYKHNLQSSIGRLAARLYRVRHDNKSPPKRTVLYGGRPILENAYFEDDEDILRYAIMTYLDERDDNIYEELSSKLEALIRAPHREYVDQ